jgi:hypothetical protein
MMKSVPNFISYLHEFPGIFLNFYLFLSYFRSGVFLIQIKICRGVPPVSFSLSAPGPLVSKLSPPGVPRAVLGRHGHTPRPRHKAPTGRRPDSRSQAAPRSQRHVSDHAMPPSPLRSEAACHHTI